MVEPRGETVSLVALIPARGGSKGLPGKNIRDFCGKPLIVWSIEQAFAAGASDVIVTTDSQEIADVSAASGAGIVLRPSELADDSAPSESALTHAARAEGIGDDVIVIFLQATSPVRRVADVVRGVELLRNSSFDSVFSANRIDDLTVWTKSLEKLDPIQIQPSVERLPRQHRRPILVENGSFYIFRAGALMRNQSRLHGRIGEVSTPIWTMNEIDDQEDWVTCEALMRKFLIEGAGTE